MKNPIQPLAKDAKGVLRFKANRIVQHLLDTHPACDMNKLAALDFSDDDRQQFAQLIGYSLSGYSELQSYVDDEAYGTAAHMADGLDERDARIAALEQKLAELRAAAAQQHDDTARSLESGIARCGNEHLRIVMRAEISHHRAQAANLRSADKGSPE